MFYTVIVVYIVHPSCDSSSSRYRFCHSKPEGDVLLRALPEKIPFFAGLRFLVAQMAFLSFRTYVRNLCHSLLLRFLVAALTRNDITRGFVICYNHPNSSAKSFFEGLLAAISKSFFSLLQAFISFSLAIASSTQLYSSK